MDVAHQTLVFIGKRRLIRVTFDIHLVAQLLQSAFNGIIGRELVATADRRLNILHVFFGLDLNDCRFAEYHFK